MKQNIFQKISFLMYCMINILILIYFVPYYSEYLGNLHASIVSDISGNILYPKFIIYLLIPLIIYYYLNKNLEELNLLDSSKYKKQAKLEIYTFILFLSVLISSILFMHLKNEFSENHKKSIDTEIFKIKKDIINNEQIRNFRHNVFVKIPHFQGYLWTESNFLAYIDYSKGFVEEVYQHLHDKHQLKITESLFKQRMVVKTPEEVSVLEKEKEFLIDKLDSKTKELKSITFYSDETIKFNIAIILLTLILILYVFRYLLIFFRDMLIEVNQK